MEAIEFSANQAQELKNVGQIIAALVQKQEQLTAEVEHLVKTNQTIAHNCEVLQSRCQEYANKVEMCQSEKLLVEQNLEQATNKAQALERHNETLKKQLASLQSEKDDAIKERQSIATQFETASIHASRRGSISGLGGSIGGMGNVVSPLASSGLRTPTFLKPGLLGGVGLGASSAFRPLSAMSNASMRDQPSGLPPRPPSAISDTESFQEQRSRLHDLLNVGRPDRQGGALGGHETPGAGPQEERGGHGGGIMGGTPGGPSELTGDPKLDQYNSMLDTRLQQMRHQLEQARREYSDLRVPGVDSAKAGSDGLRGTDNLPDVPPPPFNARAGYAQDRKSEATANADAALSRHDKVSKIADSILNGTFGGQQPTSMATILENPNPNRRRRRRNSAEALPQHIPPPPVQAGGLGGALAGRHDFRSKRSQSSPNLGFGAGMNPELLLHKGPPLGPPGGAMPQGGSF